jgi:hypothetical protein
MIRAAGLALGLTLLPALGAAQSVSDCDGWIGAARNLAEPWDENTRTFANGAVRLAVLDTLEPAAGAFHLLILSPPYTELGDRQCRIVGGRGGLGFAGMMFSDLDASYDPAVGLIWTLPVVVLVSDTGDFQTVGLRVTLNQATGDVGTTIFPVD